MQIVGVLRSFHLFPNRSAEIGTPVVRLVPVYSLFKVKILGERSLRIRYRLPKPLMLITAMVYHKVQENIHIPLLRLGNQLLHVFIGAESRINLVVILNIIALVGKRRKKAGRNPDNINSEFLQIIELFNNPLDVSNSIPLRILKTLRINLISDLLLPPLFFHSFSLSTIQKPLIPFSHQRFILYKVPYSTAKT